MARRSPQAQVALIAAAVFLVVGVSLAAVVIIGLADGVTGSGPFLLAALAIGVLALAARLIALARRPAPPPRGSSPHTSPTTSPNAAAPPRQAPRAAAPAASSASSASSPTARPVHPRPHPRPKSMRP